jgi:hypothetical protein
MNGHDSGEDSEDFLPPSARTNQTAQKRSFRPWANKPLSKDVAAVLLLAQAVYTMAERNTNLVVNNADLAKLKEAMKFLALPEDAMAIAKIIRQYGGDFLFQSSIILPTTPIPAHCFAALISCTKIRLRQLKRPYPK